MKLYNQSKQVVISKNVKEAVCFSDRALGLLKKSNPRSLIFKTRFGIHTFFLDKPIDVLILDRNLKVVKMCQYLRPNRLLFWSPRYGLVVELPMGILKNTKIQIGDSLKLLL